MNYREQFIKRDIETLKANKNMLMDWEKEFLTSISENSDHLSCSQFNTLQAIAMKIKGEK